MKLTITKKASERLKELDPKEKATLALTYDTDGCGCGVNGMPTFSLVTYREKNHKDVICDQRKAVVHHQEATFFAKEMTLDYNGATFRLTSPNEMLNPFIHFNQTPSINERA